MARDTDNRFWCNVCSAFVYREDMESNYRGMLTCPTCETELAKDSAHSGKVKRDRFSHK